MNKITETIMKYTEGKATLEEANEILRQERAGITLHPEKNILTQKEIQETLIGTYPNQARGYGLLDTGTGTLDKVHITGGKLDNCDCGDMPALLYIAGRMYHVAGTKLVE